MIGRALGLHTRTLELLAESRTNETNFVWAESNLGREKPRRRGDDFMEAE